MTRPGRPPSPMTLTVLAQKDSAYTLYWSGREHILSVACAGADTGAVNIRLLPEEAAQSLADLSLLEAWASEIRNHPRRFSRKSIALS